MMMMMTTMMMMMMMMMMMTMIMRKLRNQRTERPLIPSDTDDGEILVEEFEGDDDLEAMTNGDELLDKFHPQSVSNGDNGELMVSLSPSTIANLWAVTGLLLLVNITFCLYRVCKQESK